MSDLNPKLNDGIRFFSIGNDMYHVYDATTSRHFKMGRQEVGWLKLLDGNAGIDALREQIPVEYFDNFLRKIHHLGLLEGNPIKRNSSIFKIKIFNIDPSKLLEKLGNGPLFYRRFLEWVSLPILVFNILAITFLFPQVGRIRENIEINSWSVIFYFVAILITGIVHEGSHALVARSYKVQVPKLGIMLFMLHPSFYADVSGINLLSHRAQRVKVLLAGIMGNNLLIFISVLLTFLPLGVTAQQFVLLFVAINFALMFINLIPFVEFDGYYVFQELVGEPRFGRNALINMLSPQAKKIEYTMYAHISLIFQFVMITSMLIVLHRGVLLLWNSNLVDILFISLIIGVYPCLIIYRIKNAR